MVKMVRLTERHPLYTRLYDHPLTHDCGDTWMTQLSQLAHLVHEIGPHLRMLGLLC